MKQLFDIPKIRFLFEASELAYSPFEKDNLTVVEFLNYYNFQLVFASSVEDSKHTPAFFVGINRSVKKILVSVRGTVSFEDVFNDLLTHPSKFGEWNAHSGVVKAASWIYQKLEPFFSLYRDFETVFTGHSLVFLAIYLILGRRS